MAYREIKSRNDDIKTFSELADAVTVIADVTDTDEAIIKPVTNDNNETTQKESVTYRDISAVLAENSDCIGWIYIDGTNINYPVMNTPYEPQRYIRRDFYGKYSSSGVPFFDSECSVDSDNIIIYGHNMTNGTMFAMLEEYYSEQFFFSHPVIEFQTENNLYMFDVFAVLKVKNNDDWYYFIDADGKETFDNAVSILKSKAIHSIDYIPEYGDKFITLSTCHGRTGDNRTILVGVLRN